MLKIQAKYRIFSHLYAIISQCSLNKLDNIESGVNNMSFNLKQCKCTRWLSNGKSFYLFLWNMYKSFGTHETFEGRNYILIKKKDDTIMKPYLL